MPSVYPFFTTTLDQGVSSASNPFGSLQITTKLSEDSWRCLQEGVRKRILAEYIKENERKLMVQWDSSTHWYDASAYQIYCTPTYHETYRRPEVQKFEPPKNSYPITFRQELQEFINNWLKGISI